MNKKRKESGQRKCYNTYKITRQCVTKTEEYVNAGPLLTEILQAVLMSRYKIERGHSGKEEGQEEEESKGLYFCFAFSKGKEKQTRPSLASLTSLSPLPTTGFFFFNS